jgi:hypothetical protein
MVYYQFHCTGYVSAQKLLIPFFDTNSRPSISLIERVSTTGIPEWGNVRSGVVDTLRLEHFDQVHLEPIVFGWGRFY